MMQAKNFALTAAVLPAVVACPAARVYVGPKTEPGHAQWWGIAIHRYLEYVKTRGHDAALAYIEAKFPRAARCCSLIDLTQVPHGRLEAKFVINTQTDTVEEGRTANVDAAVHVHGRADLVYSVESPYENAVLDWKTGKKTDFDVSTNEQLLLLSVALWLQQSKRDLPIHAAIVAVRSNGHLEWYRDTYTPEKLDSFYKHVKTALENMRATRLALYDDGIKPERINGPHCNACFANTVCPDAKLTR